MTVLQLRYFLAVVETGSITAAAKREGVSQANLSEQILRLESPGGGLGRKLFARQRRASVLTAAGVALLPHARRAAQALVAGEAAVAAAPQF